MYYTSIFTFATVSSYITLWRPIYCYTVPIATCTSQYLEAGDDRDWES
jgi:hypothetical protein